MGTRLFIRLLLTTGCCLMAIPAMPHSKIKAHCDQKHNGPNCWGSIRAGGCKGTTLQDFGSLCRYPDIATGKDNHCGNLVAQKALEVEASLKSQAGAARLCQQLGAGSHKIQAFSVVGVNHNTGQDCQSNRDIGTLVCEQVCTCPGGDWTFDANGPGTKDCKRLACLVSGTEPPNNTPISDWGFTWGSGIWEWGPANCSMKASWR